MPNIYERIIKPNLDKIISMRREGYTLHNIAAKIGVTYQSIYNYSKTQPELQEALDEGRKALLGELEQTLFHKAIGGAVRTTTRIQHNDKTGETITTTTEAVDGADVTALIFALKTNYPEIYATLEGRENEDVVNAINDLANSIMNDETE